MRHGVIRFARLVRHVMNFTSYLGNSTDTHSSSARASTTSKTTPQTVTFRHSYKKGGTRV